MIRYGVAMYGLNPSGNKLAPSYALKPALRLTSELIHVKRLAAGEGIGYGETYVTEAEEWIGTVPIGYADGWLRHLQGFTVLVNGKRCEIVGRVYGSMYDSFSRRSSCRLSRYISWKRWQ